MNEITFYESPVGWLEIISGDEGISSLQFRETGIQTGRPSSLPADCIRQLDLYFSGHLKFFDLPLVPSGTPFQIRVWKELLEIPYGQVITYKSLAIRVQGPTFTRIVGQANARNPLAILIPCHRVVGMSGALTGYAGGIPRKKFLLDLEQKGSGSGIKATLFYNVQ